MPCLKGGTQFTLNKNVSVVRLVAGGVEDVDVQYEDLRLGMCPVHLIVLGFQTLIEHELVDGREVAGWAIMRPRRCL